MRRCSRLLAALLALAALPSAIAAPAAGQTAEPDSPLADLRVVDQRSIDLGDLRLLGMSPDGHWLAAYGGATEGSAAPEHLCAVAVADLGDRRCADLIGVDAGLWVESVVWSPDSTRLVFAEQAFQRLVDGDLWMFEVETAALVDLTDDRFAGRLPIFEEGSLARYNLDVAPAWSPDGRQLAFSRTSWHDGEFHGTAIERIAAVAGARPEPVVQVTTEEPGVVYFPILWTPDGERLIYNISHTSPGDLQNGLWMVNLADRQPRRLLNQSRELGAPIPLEVSADGAHVLVVYSALAMQTVLDESPYELIGLATKQVEPVGPPATRQPPQPIANLATFSPDGAMILYVTHLTDPENQVVVRDLATGSESTLVAGLAAAVMLRFGRNVTWAENGTVFVPSDLHTGEILELAGERARAQRPRPTPSPASTTPPMATPETGASATAPSTGATAVTNDANVSLPAAPSTHAPNLAELSWGSEVAIFGAAETGSGFVWWPVRDPTTRTIGYVRAEFLSPPSES